MILSSVILSFLSLESCVHTIHSFQTLPHTYSPSYEIRRKHGSPLFATATEASTSTSTQSPNKSKDPGVVVIPESSPGGGVTKSNTDPKSQQQQSQSESKPKPKTTKKISNSKRLNKARRLLSEYQMNPVEVIDMSSKKETTPEGLGDITILKKEVDDVDEKPSTPKKQNEQRNQAVQENMSKADDTQNTNLDVDPVAVPDSYWSNAHLQGSGDYVTRWAGGVKVAEPLIRYDPVAAEKLLFRQPTKWVVRNIQIALPLGLWASGVITDLISGNEEKNRRSRAQQLLRTISRLGPAIIKGGQALASRPDLMSGEYLEELQKLQDDVPRYENDLAFSIVEEELGTKFENVFELLQDGPIAAASIGQVYKARLLSNGDTVALKIQRPKCEEIIALDLYVLRWWSGVATSILKALGRDIDVQSIIDDFGELIYRELDYVAEAANAQRFSELYAAVTDVFVPKVYSDLTTRRVLTMEWVDGYRLTDSNNLQNNDLDKKKLLDTLIQCSLRQILENGFFHADPHAGNLLACSDGRLCYLDFGMMSYAKESQRNGFLLAVVHVVNRDWEELVSLYQRLGFIPEGTDLSAIEVALEKALPDVLNADVAELNFKNVINQLSDIFYTYPFSLPPFYISIIRCLGVLEGLAIQVDPQTRVISEAYPYIASRVLTDPQDDLQEAFRRLAFTSEGNIRWNRLEGLLEEAQESSGYDVTVALDQLTNYLISDDGEILLKELSDQIVESADILGIETTTYAISALQALLIDDEVRLVKAMQSLQRLVQQQQSSSETEELQAQFEKDLQDVLPEPPNSLVQLNKILSLLRTQTASGNSEPSKFLPLLRKLAQEPRVGRYLNTIILELGERALSRGLRAAFGLPPPEFQRRSSMRNDVANDRDAVDNKAGVE